jgi:hypothetical protein
MRRGLIVLLFLMMIVCSTLAHSPSGGEQGGEQNQHLDTNTTRKWFLAVEEILSSITVGKLKSDFNPAYLAQRTTDSVLQGQVARFRAKLSRQLIECATTQATVCIDPTVTSDDAVKVVLKEFKDLTFDIVWSRSEDACPSALVVRLPPPKTAAAAAAGTAAEDKLKE